MKMVERQVCQLCGHDDELTVMPIGDGREWSFVCHKGRHHAAPYAWEARAEPPGAGRSGVMADLGLFDDLLACVRAGEPWLEHGVVEHRYKLLRPTVYFDELLPLYGHTAQRPKRYTLSSLLAGAMGLLARDGLLAWQRGPGTGYWHFDSVITYWALPPGPDPSDVLRWRNFAAAEGLDPARWDLTPPAAVCDRLG